MSQEQTLVEILKRKQHDFNGGFSHVLGLYLVILNQRGPI